MMKYTQFIGPAYFFTTDPNEIPRKTRRAIEEKASFDFTREHLLAACGIDQIGSRGNIWVVVSKERIVAYKCPVLHQNIFRDLTGVNRSITSDIVLHSPGNKSDLFHLLLMPHKKLLDRMFHIIHTQWITVQKHKVPQNISITQSGCNSVDQLERLAKLHKEGHLNDEEFASQKAKVLEVQEQNNTVSATTAYSSEGLQSDELPSRVTKSQPKLPEIGFLSCLIGWVVGLFFLLMSIGVFAELAILGIIFITIAMLFLPPVRRTAYRITHISMSGKMRLILIIVLLGMSGWAMDITQQKLAEIENRKTAELARQQKEAARKAEVARIGEASRGFEGQTFPYSFGARIRSEKRVSSLNGLLPK